MWLKFPAILSAAGLLALALLAAAPLRAQRFDRQTLNITGYVIDAEIDTTTHHLTATAQVSFTAPGKADR